MKSIPQDWDKNVREHIQERLATEKAIRSGKKTAWQVQEENSIIPTNAKIKIDWADLSRRFENAPRARRAGKRKSKKKI